MVWRQLKMALFYTEVWARLPCSLKISINKSEKPLITLDFQ
jgi:hypothetical protein